MNKVAKVASGTTAAIGLGGTAYGTYDYKTTTVEYSLNPVTSGLEFVEAGDVAQLKALVSSYNASAERNGIEIFELDLGDNDSKSQKLLFDKCQELRSTSIRFKYEDVYKKLQTQVSHWCVVIKDIEDALSREVRAVLSDSSEKSDFDVEFDAHKVDPDFKVFLNKQNQGNLDKQTDLQTYKNNCQNLLKKKVSDADYISNLGKARNYCAKKPTSVKK